MANIVNLFAEVEPSMLSDDSSPALTLTNTGAGAGIRITTTPAANATIGVPIRVGVGSVASGAVLALTETAFVSAVSIVFAASANWAGLGVMRIVRTDGSFGWVPVLPDAVVTAAARA